MEEKIRALFYKLQNIRAPYLNNQKQNNSENVKKVIPEIQEFVLWFLEENRFGIENDIYQGMKNNLLEILKDILAALQQNDTVLLYDATMFGLVEYLQLFINIEQEERGR